MGRRLAVLALAAVLVVGGVVGVRALRGDGGSGDGRLERAGSAEAKDSTPVEIEDEPAGYRITYRVTLRNGADSTEELRVRRPFTSETVIQNGAGGGERTAFGRQITATERKDPIVLAVGPTLAAGDLRLAPALDDAVSAGLLERREQRVVAGARCQVYRTGPVAGAGPLQRPTSDDHVDVCIDGRGLVLEEWSVVGGVPFRQQVATDVRLQAPRDLGATWSDVAPSMGVEEGGGSILRLRPDSAPPGEVFELPSAPAGFRHLGRWSVIPPQPEAFGDKGDRYTIRSNTVDVWRHGIDVLVLEQGSSLGGRPVFTIDPSNRVVPIEGIGDVEVRIGLAGNEVRVLRPAGHYVRVAGTLPVDELLDIMRGLRAEEGTGLEVVRGPLLPEP